MALMNESGVYLLHAVGIKKYKIGKTINLSGRFTQLNHLYPIELRILKFWAIEQYQELETNLHRMFGEYRLGITDWFDLPETIAYKLSKISAKELMDRINIGRKL
jgi:hypothetical protein